MLLADVVLVPNVNKPLNLWRMGLLDSAEVTVAVEGKIMGPLLGQDERKVRGRPCLSQASAAASHPVGPGKVSMALSLHPERREQGRKGRNEYIQ